MYNPSYGGVFSNYAAIIAAGIPNPGVVSCVAAGASTLVDGGQGEFFWNAGSSATQNTNPNNGPIILNPGLGSAPGRWFLGIGPSTSAFGAGFINWNSTNYSGIITPLLRTYNGVSSTKIISIGDSLSHGTVQIGSSSGYNITAQQGWVWQMGQRFSALGFPAVSFDNFCGSSLSATSYPPGDSRLTQPATWNVNGSFAYGIGGPPAYSWTQTGVRNTVSPTFAFDKLRLVTITDPTYGEVKLYLDGSLLDTIDTGVADATLAKTYTVSRGVHTVGIEPLNSTSVFCMSVSCEDSATNYLYCDTLGGGGYTTATWLSAISPGREPIPDQLNAYDPFQIAFIWLGANDMFTGISASTFQTNLGTIVQYVKDYGAAPILINTPLANTSGFPSLAVQSTYAQAVYAVAAAKNCPLLDMNALINGNTYNNISNPTPGQLAGYVGADGTHFTSTGYTYAGQTLANNLFNQLFITP